MHSFPLNIKFCWFIIFMWAWRPWDPLLNLPKMIVFTTDYQTTEIFHTWKRFSSFFSINLFQGSKIFL
jgi:hypothetical protein